MTGYPSELTPIELLNKIADVIEEHIESGAVCDLCTMHIFNLLDESPHVTEDNRI